MTHPASCSAWRSWVSSAASYSSLGASWPIAATGSSPPSRPPAWMAWRPGRCASAGSCEAVDQLLTSPLQSRPCVWYRARIESTDDSRRVLLDEERAVHFRITDGRGSIRVAPTGARWEIGTDLRRVDEPDWRRAAGPRRGGSGASYDMVVPNDPEDMTEPSARRPSMPCSRVRPAGIAGAASHGVGAAGSWEAAWRPAAAAVTGRPAWRSARPSRSWARRFPGRTSASSSKRWRRRQRRPGHRRRHRGRTRSRRSWRLAPRKPGATRPSRASASVSRRAPRSSTRMPSRRGRRSDGPRGSHGPLRDTS